MSKRPTPADLALFLRSMNRLSALTKDDLSAAAPLLSVRSLGRGEHFLRAGEPAELAGMVTHGSVREYYGLKDGSERTKAFVFAGNLTGSMADLISKAPSTSYVVADEEARLLSVRFEDLVSLAARMPNWDRVFRRLIEQLYLRKARREYEFLALDAEARFQRLLEEQPQIESQVQARHIASYLGITPVHLSRLRRRRRAAQKRA
jgi:CRP-like cAMP-binding protein